MKKVQAWLITQGFLLELNIFSKAKLSLSTHSFSAMGGPCELRLYSETSEQKNISTTLISEVNRLEKKYSRYLKASVVNKINASAGNKEGIIVDEETANLLDYANTCFIQSDGLFDITAGILHRAWDFKNFHEQKILPKQETLHALLENVGWNKAKWNRPLLHLPLVDMEIDLGGLVKEYACDCVATLAKKTGLAHGLIDLSGDICVIGPQVDGRPWKIGIRDPFQPSTAIAEIELFHGALATSGSYERFIEIAGKRYHHIINPKNGWPLTELASVSVAADQCIVAGTLSTIAMLKGRTGIKWLEHLELPNIIISDKGEISGTLLNQSKVN